MESTTAAMEAELEKLNESHKSAMDVMHMVSDTFAKTTGDQTRGKRLIDVIARIAIDTKLLILKKERALKDMQKQMEIASAADPDAAAAAHAASVVVAAIKAEQAAVADMHALCVRVKELLPPAEECKSASVLLASLEQDAEYFESTAKRIDKKLADVISAAGATADTEKERQIYVAMKEKYLHLESYTTVVSPEFKKFEEVPTPAGIPAWKEEYLDSAALMCEKIATLKTYPDFVSVRAAAPAETPAEKRAFALDAHHAHDCLVEIKAIVESSANDAALSFINAAILDSERALEGADKKRKREDETFGSAE